ncbi:MAG: hypothetical protein ACFB11_20895 [Paracoccaceae bacterium]
MSGSAQPKSETGPLLAVMLATFAASLFGGAWFWGPDLHSALLILLSMIAALMIDAFRLAQLRMSVAKITAAAHATKQDLSQSLERAIKERDRPRVQATALNRALIESIEASESKLREIFWTFMQSRCAIAPRA